MHRPFYTQRPFASTGIAPLPRCPRLLRGNVFPAFGIHGARALEMSATSFVEVPDSHSEISLGFPVGGIYLGWQMLQIGRNLGVVVGELQESPYRHALGLVRANRRILAFYIFL